MTSNHHGNGGADRHDDTSDLKAAAFHATLHCATGCVSGEVLGLAIGISLGLGAWATIALGTGLAFFIGLSLATFPLARRLETSPREALGMIWLGETASILAMEVVMNLVDYALGGVGAASVFSSQFWMALAAAAPLGFAAAYPVNYLMIARGLAEHHH